MSFRVASLLLLLLSSSFADDSDAATRALFAAVGADDAAGVREAVSRGAALNTASPGDGQTPLMRASLQGRAAAVRALLALGADATVGEKDGYTPLHGAAFQGRAAVARVLLADPRVPNERHADGSFPIHRACWGRDDRYADTVRAFLEAGEPLDRRDGQGNSVLDVARRTGNAKVLDVLTTWGGAGEEL
jgi:ankyrin repeat protein